MSDWENFSYTERVKTRPTEYLQRDPGKQIPNAFAAMVEPLDVMEEVAERIYNSQSIYNATGRDLDRFGEYVGVSRNSRSDDAYRQDILRRKFTEGGSGTEADVSKLASAVTNYARLYMIEHYPAAYIMHISGPIVPTDICKILDQASVGGVRAYSTHDYGLGGFALAGIDVAQGQALQVDVETAMRAGNETQAMGLTRGGNYITGSRLAAGGQVRTTVGGDLQVNDDLLVDEAGNNFYVGYPDYSDGTNSAMLCGAMPK